MLGGISIWQLLIVFVIVILIFGTKKLRNLGGDLGGAVKGFKNAINETLKKPTKRKMPHNKHPSFTMRKMQRLKARLKNRLLKSKKTNKRNNSEHITCLILVF